MHNFIVETRHKCIHVAGDAEFGGVENAGVEISGEGKVWKAKV